MKEESNLGTPIEIGFSSSQCWETMHRANNRIIYFGVQFEELQCPPHQRDYQICLSDLWLPLLNATGLSAAIYHGGWSPVCGLHPGVLGWVWRQHGSVSVGSVSETELFQLSDHLRVPYSKVKSFCLMEYFTTLKYSRNTLGRKIKLTKDGFSIEPPPEQDSARPSSPPEDQGA